jgi:N,N-dimethylformamidase
MAELAGYTDRLSVAPGDAVAFHVSTDAEAYDLRIVRMLHGDQNAAGPGHRERAVDSDVEGRYAGRVQVAHAGSFGLVEHHRIGAAPRALTFAAFVQPTLPGNGREQGVMSWWWPAGDAGLSLRIGADGRVALHVGGGTTVTADAELRAWSWYFVAGGVDLASGTARLVVHPLDPLGVSAPVLVDAPATGSLDADAPLLLAAIARPDAAAEAQAEGHFNGKLDRPQVFTRLLDAAELTALATGDAGAPADAVARWEFSLGMDTDVGHDVVGSHHARLLNMPARAMTGHNWAGDETNPAHAPEQYGAVHFHDDDLDDCRWAADATWTVPEDLPSGTYAARLDADGRDTEYLPFTVRPKPGRPTARVAVLIPTMTYLAYANERLVVSGLPDGVTLDTDAGTDRADEVLLAHPEWGRSLYDVHDDGSGVAYSTWRRPIPNMRPGYRFWATGGTERYASDLYLIDWLDAQGIAVDVLNDEDLHAGGAALLADYRTVLTSCHPEYYSRAMLDGVEQYVAGGGRLMYLGGNGFYWVTSFAPDRPHVIELRRGFNGSRAWESRPGEGYHSTTGERGGLWRYRGRNPNRLVGVGFTAQSDSHNRAAGYDRLPDSRRPEVAFIFEGVGEDEVIGDFGLINDGAAGYEIDRHDPELGEPEVCWRLATSQGRHDASYLLVTEDQGFTMADNNGANCDKVRADIVYARVGAGEIFSVGSCNWCASLSHDGYDNNVSRITGNVLRRFAGGLAEQVSDGAGVQGDT